VDGQNPEDKDKGCHPGVEQQLSAAGSPSFTLFGGAEVRTFAAVPRYYLINKPYGCLSQFTREADHHQVLGDLYDFPPDVYPVGRLDRDSEGLLILTDDKKLNAALLHPTRKQVKTYWVRVEGTPTGDALGKLAAGISIRIKKKVHHCAPVEVRVLSDSETMAIPERDPPVRYRKSVPDAWLELRLTEGKNRQVRRMCAAVGLPVLRLIRVGINELSLADLGNNRVHEAEYRWLMPKLGLRQ